MARVSYPPEVRSAFIAAAQNVRAAGKSWADALVAAEAQGYKGSEQALYQLILRVEREQSDESHEAQTRAESEHESPTKPGSAEHRAGYSAADADDRQDAPARCLEFKTLILTTQQSPDTTLNELGQQGWTLVAATPVSTVLLPEGANVTRIQYVLQRAL